MMKDIENKEKKEIKQLKKDFRGMKERFQTRHLVDFKLASTLFQTNLYRAYKINDFNLNEEVIKSYQEIVVVLSERLANKNEKLQPEIEEAIFTFSALMNSFWSQAGKQY